MSTQFITAPTKLIAAFAVAAAVIISFVMTMPTYAAASTGDDWHSSSWNDNDNDHWNSNEDWNTNNNWDHDSKWDDNDRSIAVAATWSDLGWKDSNGNDWWRDCSQSMWDTHKNDWWKSMNDTSFSQWSTWCMDTQRSHMQNSSDWHDGWNQGDDWNKDYNRDENDSWSTNYRHDDNDWNSHDWDSDDWDNDDWDNDDWNSHDWNCSEENRNNTDW